MQYRELGKTGENLSILGFGAMRLPVIDGKDADVDEVKAVEMIRRSIDRGVNYLDTAYPYHGGKSERVCARAMKDGYREKVRIATKLPSWDIRAHEDMERILDEQIDKLEVDTIDFYLLHALSRSFWPLVKDNDYKSFIEKAKANGKIRYTGFSFHDNIDLFKEIIDDYDWDFCQIQLNYLDDNYQAGIEGMRYAAERGIGVIVMEPLRGGMLSRTELPPEVEALWKSADEYRTPTEWALRYVWNFPEISVVLSGMSTMEHVEENIRTASQTLPESLSEKDKSIIHKVKDFYNDRMVVNCTNCRYCMPCPSGVNIPELFWAYNHDSIFNDRGKVIFWVNGWLKEHERPSKCINCGECEEHCPQNISIREHLKIIEGKYEGKD